MSQVIENDESSTNAKICTQYGIDNTALQQKMQRYLKKERIGEGTYAIVYKAIDTLTSQTVAIKRHKPSPRTLLDISSIRELNALKSLPPHPNILQLLDVYHTPDTMELCLVLDYHATDLEMLIKDRKLIFTAGNIKAWMLMILRAVEHMHQRFLIHRVNTEMILLFY